MHTISERFRAWSVISDRRAFGPDDGVRVVIETPPGTGAKFSLDAETGAFQYLLLASEHSYPLAWSFTPSICPEEHAPQHGIVLRGAASYRGVVISCDPPGVLRVVQTEEGATERSDLYILKPVRSPLNEVQDGVEELPTEIKTELEQFFTAAFLGTGNTVEFLGWHGAGTALKRLRQGAGLFSQNC